MALSPDQDDPASIVPDEAMIARHLDTWFAGATGGLIEIAWYAGLNGGLTKSKRFAPTAITETAAFIAKTNRRPGQSIYFRPALVAEDAPSPRCDQHFLAAPGTWADIDDGDAAQSASKVCGACKPNLVIVTGQVPALRCQLFWKSEEALGNSHPLRDLNCRIAAKLHGDPLVTNPTSLMRIAGTIAWPRKPGRTLERTELITFNDDRPAAYDAAALERAFPPAEERRPNGLDFGSSGVSRH
jgi:hypothetical protein